MVVPHRLFMAVAVAAERCPWEWSVVEARAVSEVRPVVVLGESELLLVAVLHLAAEAAALQARQMWRSVGVLGGAGVAVEEGQALRGIPLVGHLIMAVAAAAVVLIRERPLLAGLPYMADRVEQVQPNPTWQRREHNPEVEVVVPRRLILVRVAMGKP